MRVRCSLRLAWVAALAAAAGAQSAPSGLHVAGLSKISDTAGGFGGLLDFKDWFGYGVAGLGDLDGDGVVDVAVGAPGDDGTNGFSTGAVWILFLDVDGSVKSHRRILNQLDADSLAAVGANMTRLGDLDGDGVTELAVLGDHTPWILFLNSDGTLKDHVKLDEAGGPVLPVDTIAVDEIDLAAPGDVDGDGVLDLAVCRERYRVWVYFLNTDGTVREYTEIVQADASAIGMEGLAAVGDLDLDGVPDLATGTYLADRDVRYLFLNADGSLKGALDVPITGCGDDGLVGSGLDAVGDLDGNGIIDLAVSNGAHGGQLWLTTLDALGVPLTVDRIDATTGGPLLEFRAEHGFPASVAPIGDLDGDGVGDLIAGTPFDDDGGEDHGAVWILRMGLGPAPPQPTLGTTYCSPAVANSTGLPGRLVVRGSDVLTDDRFVLTALDLPPESNAGYFLMGTGNAVFVPPGAVGPICVTPGMRRLLSGLPENTDDRCGSFERIIYTQTALFAPVTPGSTWNFQAWHRDSAAGTSNFTDAVSVAFH